MVFWWNCLKFEANIERDMEKEVEDNMSTLFVDLTQGSNVTDCSLNVVIKLKLFIFHLSSCSEMVSFLFTLSE